MSEQDSYSQPHRQISFDWLQCQLDWRHRAGELIPKAILANSYYHYHSSMNYTYLSRDIHKLYFHLQSSKLTYLLCPQLILSFIEYLSLRNTRTYTFIYTLLNLHVYFLHSLERVVEQSPKNIDEVRWANAKHVE